MNLISCKTCDKDRLEFPDPWDEENHGYSDDCLYDDELGFFAKLPCPVCKGDIPEKE